jgi:hypothetical protein
VYKIGSRVLSEVLRAELLLQVVCDGDEASSKVTRKVSRPEMNITLPVAQLTPSEGSPAPRPRPPGAA